MIIKYFFSEREQGSLGIINRNNDYITHHLDLFIIIDDLGGSTFSNAGVV